MPVSSATANGCRRRSRSSASGSWARSQKENEHRLPLHPRHLDRIPADLRGRIYLEARLRRALRRLRRRARPSSWPGCAPTGSSSTSATSSCSPSRCTPTSPSCARARCCGAGRTACRTQALTQLAIDRGLTLIAFEAMNHWKRDGSFGLHVFHKNNELAGYCSVLHALQLAGVDRRLRPPAARRRHRLRGHGPWGGHGARRALGVDDVDVLTNRAGGRGRRADPLGAHPALRQRRRRAGREPRGDRRRGRCRWPQFLGEHDIIVNCVLQDTDAPARLPDRGRPGRALARHPRRRRLLRRGHGLRVGPPDDLRRPDVRGRPRRPLLRRRPQPVATCGAPPPGRSARPCCPSSGPVHGGSRRLGPRRHHPPGDRDPRRRHPEPRDPVRSRAAPPATRTEFVTA